MQNVDVINTESQNHNILVNTINWDVTNEHFILELTSSIVNHGSENKMVAQLDKALFGVVTFWRSAGDAEAGICRANTTIVTKGRRSFTGNTEKIWRRNDFITIYFFLHELRNFKKFRHKV